MEIDGLAFGGRDSRRDADYHATDIVLNTWFAENDLIYDAIANSPAAYRDDEHRTVLMQQTMKVRLPSPHSPRLSCAA